VFPETVCLKVLAAPEGVAGTEKEVTLEKEILVKAPHFIEVGDQVVVNTEDFSYVERVTTKTIQQDAVPGTGQHGDTDKED
jgi:hypothetical protein